MAVSVPVHSNETLTEAIVAWEKGHVSCIAGGGPQPCFAHIKGPVRDILRREELRVSRAAVAEGLLQATQVGAI